MDTTSVELTCEKQYQDIKIGIPPAQIAEDWEAWCGETAWSKSMRRFGELGGLAVLWCGFPQSKSAIPLCFSLFRPDGTELPGKSRLKDIRHAITILESN